MKKAGFIFLILVILVGSIFLYQTYKRNSIENAVIEYLIKDKKIEKNNIITSEAFISKLSGDRNLMVGVKLKNNNKTYFYFKKDGEIILESYVEDGVEYVQ